MIKHHTKIVLFDTFSKGGIMAHMNRLFLSTVISEIYSLSLSLSLVASSCLKLPKVALSCLHFPAAIIDCRCLWIQPGCRHLHSCSSDQLEVNPIIDYFPPASLQSRHRQCWQEKCNFQPSLGPDSSSKTQLVRQHRAQAQARVQTSA